MSARRRLRVLVVDDSAHNRRALVEVLGGHPEIEVVGTAEDGEKGLKAVVTLRPDLVTLDLEMPRMDGFTFLRLVMAQMPTPVIVISMQSRKQQVFQTLELGALDFIAKPSRYFAADDGALRQELVDKVLAVGSLQVMPFRRRAEGALRRPEAAAPPAQAPAAAAAATAAPTAAAAAEVRQPRVERLVCIGASTGGPPALQSIFKALQLPAHAAVLVAQHMPEKFTRAFADRLDRLSPLLVREATHQAPLFGHHAYIAPGGTHLQLLSGRPAPLCQVSAAAEADRYVPSIDQLFGSAAALFGERLLAVVLTGMGADGSQGVRAVRRAGGRVVAESQQSAIVFGMPKEAEATGCVDAMLPLEGIIEHIHQFVRGAG